MVGSALPDHVVKLQHELAILWCREVDGRITTMGAVGGGQLAAGRIEECQDSVQGRIDPLGGAGQKELLAFGGREAEIVRGIRSGGSIDGNGKGQEQGFFRRVVGSGFQEFGQGADREQAAGRDAITPGRPDFIESWLDSGAGRDFEIQAFAMHG